MKFVLSEKSHNIRDLKRLVNSEPYFIFVMGATGAGKNYIVKKFLPTIPLVDIDKFMAKLSSESENGDERQFISKSIAMAKKELDKYFGKLVSVVQTGTGGNLKGLENKLILAKSKGMKTALILVDTDIEKAKVRNQRRADSGEQRLVPDWKIDVSYKASKENFFKLKDSVDFFTIVKN